MATVQNEMQITQLEQERYMLKDKQDLVQILAAALSGIHSKESAGRRILEEIEGLEANGHPEDIGAGDRQRATAALQKLAKERSVLEVRMEAAKQRIVALQANIARYDQPKLQRLKKIRELFSQLAG
jgi:hypothetical protein